MTISTPTLSAITDSFLATGPNAEEYLTRASRIGKYLMSEVSGIYGVRPFHQFAATLETRDGRVAALELDTHVVAPCDDDEGEGIAMISGWSLSPADDDIEVSSGAFPSGATDITELVDAVTAWVENTDEHDEDAA